MQAYFFDVVTSAGVQHDFHGRRLATLDEAHELAKMITLDLECCDVLWVATDVVVRDVRGARLYSVAVRHPDQIAA